MKVLAVRFDDAEALLAQGIKQDPDFAYNYGLRAYVRIRLDDIEGAIADCSSKIRIKPDDASSYALRGWAHYCLNQHSKAIEDIEKSLSLNPKRINFYQDSLRLIDSYQLIDKNDQAIEFIDRMLASKIEEYIEIELYGRKAACHLKLKQLEACIDSLDKAMEHASLNDLAELHKMKSEVLEAKGEAELSEEEHNVYQRLKQFEAQITEWVPATATKRTLANFIDGAILGGAVTVVLSVSILILTNLNLLSLSDNSSLVLLLVPYSIFFFLLSFIDSLFVSIVPIIIIVSLYGWLSNQGPYVTLDNVNVLIMFFLFIFVFLSNFFYHCWFPQSHLQATPGKYLLKIKVTNSDGMKQSFQVMAYRHLLRSLPAFLVLSSTYLLLYLISINQSLIVIGLSSIVYVLVVVFAWGALLKPGFHNQFTSTHVLDSTLYFGEELTALGIG